MKEINQRPKQSLGAQILSKKNNSGAYYFFILAQTYLLFILLFKNVELLNCPDFLLLAVPAPPRPPFKKSSIIRRGCRLDGTRTKAGGERFRNNESFEDLSLLQLKTKE